MVPCRMGDDTLKGINAEKGMKPKALYALLFISATFLSSGRPFIPFSRAVDQHFLKKSFSHAPAADILVILQGNMDYSTFRGIEGWD